MNAAEYTLDLCARIAAHTDVRGTITRTFLSPATHAVHALLRAEMEALGMTVRVDSVGNLRGIYAGESPDAPTLLIGSHIDTVPDAGAYDGILGVAFGLALLRSLDGRKLPYAIEIIAFSEEEGVRFKFPFIGSRALVGTLGADDLARTDAAGITVAEAIRNFGLDPSDLTDARITPGTFAFLEVHIEQGPVLDSLHLPLAVVDSIIGQSRFAVTFTGEANHAGTTPMSFRKDALAAAAQWIAALPVFTGIDPSLLVTVGSIEVSPNASNVIPGKVTVSVDVRHPSDEIRRIAVKHIYGRTEITSGRSGVSVSGTDRGSQATVPMNPRLQQALATAVQAAGHPLHTMPSGAGHDAMILAPLVPTAMLFLRTPNGLSHHPDERVQLPDIAAALEVCAHFLNTLEPTKLSA